MTLPAPMMARSPTRAPGSTMTRAPMKTSAPMTTSSSARVSGNGAYLLASGVSGWKLVSMIRQPRPTMVLAPISTRRAAAIVLPLRPTSGPMCISAVGVSVRRWTGWSRYSGLAVRADTRAARASIVMTLPACRRTLGQPTRRTAAPIDDAAPAEHGPTGQRAGRRCAACAPRRVASSARSVRGGGARHRDGVREPGLSEPAVATVPSGWTRGGPGPGESRLRRPSDPNSWLSRSTTGMLSRLRPAIR